MTVLVDPKSGAIDEVVRSDQHYMPRLPWAVVLLADGLAVLARADHIGATLLFIIGTFWIWVAGCAACWAMRRHPHRLVLLAVPPLLIVLGIALVAHQSNPVRTSTRDEVTQPHS